MKKIVLLILLIPFLVSGQNKLKQDLGVKFYINFSKISWNDVLTEAKETGKYIYIFYDTYSCVMCNEYTTKIYSLKNVATFFNDKFINIYLQIPSYKNESYEASSIREFVSSLNLPSEINIFPTHLFFDNNATLVHKFTSVQKDSILVAQASISFDSNERYYSLIEQFILGNNDPVFLKKLFKAMDLANDSSDAFVLKFIKSRDNLFTKENAEILMNTYSHYVAFDYLYNNQNVWKKIVDEKILDIFYEKEIDKQIAESYYHLYYYRIGSDSLINLFTKKYSLNGKVQTIKFLINQFGYEKKQERFEYVLTKYVDSNVILKMNIFELNGIAWNIFLNITDTTILNKALSWSKKSIEQDYDNPAYLDTYANLLYKLGQKNEAIKYEERAISLLKNEDEIKKYKMVLEKMKKGEKTWK